MKKLGKISINPEKVIQNEELVNLKGGGYGGGGTWFECDCTYGNNPPYNKDPYCEQFESIQDAINSLDKYCVNGEGTCTQGCNV